MKKVMLLFFVIIFMTSFSFGDQVLDSFDTYDSTIVKLSEGDSPVQHLNVTIVDDPVQEGTGAFRVEWQNQCTGQWGGWISLNHQHPDTTAEGIHDGFWDWSPYTHFSIWYYVETPSSVEGEVDFRIILYEKGPGVESGQSENWISQHSVFDAVPGWNRLKIPLIKGEGATPDSGFGCPVWSGVYGNGELDPEYINLWSIEWSQQANLFEQEMDSVSGVILFDDARLTGVNPVELVFFNGKAVPNDVSMHTGWSGSAVITDEEDYATETKSIKWSGGAAWDAVYFDIASPKNLTYNWVTDSVCFKIKAEAGIGDLNLVFWDVDHDTAKEDYSFEATYTLTEASLGCDGTWKVVKIPLRDFNRFAGVWDGDLGASVAGEMDSTEVIGFRIGNMGTAITTDIYFDDIWTGNPEFDVVSPPPPAVVNVIGDTYFNNVTWQDVDGESGEVYTVYASDQLITDLTDAGVMVLGDGILEGTGLVMDFLFYPLEDHDVTKYYAVTCTDAAGNESETFTATDAVVNTAKAVPTIALGAPANFVVDGYFDEWEDAGIMPWEMSPETHTVAAGTIDDADDLSATLYLAIDDDYLYVAVDVIDDVFSWDTAGDWWTWDALEFFIGLYDTREAPHPALLRGEEPDYKMICTEDYLQIEQIDPPEVYTADSANYHFEQFSGVDYVIEYKIALDAFLVGTSDARFHPENGMRIPFEFYFHDNDGTTSGDGNNTLALSPNNTDHAWQTVEEWSVTWIGDTTHTTVGITKEDENRVINTYSLNQNYPNPFNPVTHINYSIAKNEVVKISVFNMLGQEVTNLVDRRQNAGNYTINWNANKIPSGVYFYRIQAGDFTKTRKMLLMK